VPHAARVAGIGDVREHPARDAPAAGRPAFPDLPHQRQPLPVRRRAQLLVTFPLPGGLPLPLLPAQAPLLLPQGLPPGLPPLPLQFPVLFLPDDLLRLGEHLPGTGRGRGQHGRMSVQRGPPYG
jgi:hypothetical protein